MKELIEQLNTAIDALKADGTLSQDITPKVMVNRTKDANHGDFSTNLAMMLAKPIGKNPREVAQLLLEKLSNNDIIEKIDIAGPGFINFFVKKAQKFIVIATAIEQGRNFGRITPNSKTNIQIEYVSANPTGPLHVGHGRGAAYGSALASVMREAGYQVFSEYYVNDAGRQMHILATSIYLRYLELCGAAFTFPSNGYKSEDYIYDIARTLQANHGEKLVKTIEHVFENVPADEPQGGDKEAHIDGLIANIQVLLDEQYATVFDTGLNAILNDIKADLGEFGVSFDNWYSEASLMASGQVGNAINALKSHDDIYEENGALWFKSTAYGDDKDRVVKRDNGQTTYFASDIAYHHEKLKRGFDTLIDIWGADHHGYIPRVKAAMTALDADEDKLEVQLVQFALLYRSGEQVQMSTRSGSFVTLRELREEVGNDAARFFYVMRKSDQHMDFDLDLAKSRSNENPVYYVQYAHARICRVFEQLAGRGVTYNQINGLNNLSLLDTEHEQALVKRIDTYPSLIQKAAQQRAPHLLTNYLKDLASEIHSYYNAHKVLVEDNDLRDARLNLLLAAKQVLSNGLDVLGISAPESM